MEEPILAVKDVSRKIDNGTLVLSNVSFKVNQGDILVLQGKSGSGKSTLLKCIAHLALHSGECLYRGSPPPVYGITLYRTKVLYVPQRASLLPGTPHDFLNTITSLGAHKAQKDASEVLDRAFQISEEWGIDSGLWSRAWSNLSGGEAQRILLATAVALNTAEVLLLDEPTSALDSGTSSLVENYLVERVQRADTSLKALIWVTHSPEQSRRVGTRFIYLSASGCYESDEPNFSSSDFSTTPREPRSKTPSVITNTR